MDDARPQGKLAAMSRSVPMPNVPVLFLTGVTIYGTLLGVRRMMW
jgi:hypothetical protein